VLGVSDRLALERTRLANERTILAYLRTGIALVVAGFSLINFFRGDLYVWVGVLLVPVGFGTVVLGWVRFRNKRNTILGVLQRNHAQDRSTLLVEE
jgi:putative membrane protein